MKTKQILQKIIDYGLLSALIIFPLTINIALISPEDVGHPLIAINFSLADLFIGILLLLWGLKLLVYKEWTQIKLPPFPVLIFVGIGILSFVNAYSISEWAKETIQIIEYFILFYMLLINNLKTINLAAFKNALFFSSSIILVVAFIQHTVLDGNVYLVRGLFENHNILGTFLCIVIPIVYVELLHTTQVARKIWMSLLLILSIIILTSGSAILSILISLFVVSWFLGKKIFVRFSIAIVLTGVLYPFILPAKNVNVIKEFTTIYEQGSISENYYRRLSLLGDLGKTTLFRKNVGENFLRITTDEFFATKLPEPQKGDRYKDIENKKHIKNHYLEMQASLNMILEQPLLGFGLGNFQSHIGTFYNEFPKVNTAEPNQHNGYLIIASTMGLLGLTALIWLLCSALKNSKKIFKIDKKENYTYLGLMGIIIACSVENFFSYLFVASLLIPFIFIIYTLFNKELKNAIPES